MQLALQGILKGRKKKASLYQPPKLHSARHTWWCTRIPQLSQSYLELLLQMELQVTGTCIDTPPLGWSIVIPQRWLWDISTLEKMIRNAWGDLSPSPKLRWLSLNAHFQQSHVFPDASLKNPWKGEPEDTLSPFKGEMYHEHLGICYKVAYNSTHGWKARAWGTHWVVVPQSIQCIHSSIQSVHPSMKKMGVCCCLAEWLYEVNMGILTREKTNKHTSPHWWVSELFPNPSEMRRTLQKTVTTSSKVLCFFNQIQIT